MTNNYVPNYWSHNAFKTVYCIVSNFARYHVNCSQHLQTWWNLFSKPFVTSGCERYLFYHISKEQEDYQTLTITFERSSNGILSRCFLQCVQQHQQEQKHGENYVFLVYKVVTCWFGYYTLSKIWQLDWHALAKIIIAKFGCTMLFQISVQAQKQNI